MRALLMLIMLIPASAPTTKLSALEEMQPLLDGSIRYTLPPTWELVSRTPNGLSASWKTGEAGTLTITVVPQDRNFQDPPTAAAQMGLIIGKGIRDSARKE